MKRFAVLVFLVGIIGPGALAGLAASQAGAGNAPTGKSGAVASIALRGSLTTRAALAAREFKASLSSVERAAVQHPFDSTKKTGWSYYPTNLVPRSGVEIRDLSAFQRAKLWALLRTIMSPQGYADETGVRKSDAYLRLMYRGKRTPAATFVYGEGRYFVALFGTPSRSTKWMVQLTGHHYTLNMTFSGASMSNTPYFIGANPPTRFKLDGKTYKPMAAQVAALFGAVHSLKTRQRATAQLSQRFNDVLMGPGKDGQFPPRQGITVSTLTEAQQKLVTRAIWSYVSVMPRAQAKRRLSLYEKQYSQTKLAWSGSTNPTVPGAYVRIHGPRVWIEIVLQNLGSLIGERPNFHSLERDIKSDYGAGT